MKTKAKNMILITIVLIMLTGCNKSPSKDVDSGNSEDPAGVVEPVDVPGTPPIAKEGIPSPLSGIYASEELVNRRVVGVMFDNHPSARWQAGLKDAEIVYEFPVEAPYTRYLGLYLINDPESIGSVRSSRPYFVTKIVEYDAVYVRVGGSEQAKSDIKSLKVADIDGLTSSNKVFWRKNSKKMPHNLYTSMEVIRETQEQRKYNMTGDYDSFKFKEDDEDITGYKAENILINYFTGNTTEYTYDEELKLYNRKKDGKDHTDENGNTPITAKNIIIQEVSTKVLDNEGRLEIGLIGKGIGKYMTNGVGRELTWVKVDRKSRTIYYEENGDELILNPGVTWIQMVNPKVGIIIE